MACNKEAKMQANLNEELNKIEITQNIGVKRGKWVNSDVEHEMISTETLKQFREKNGVQWEVSSSFHDQYLDSKEAVGERTCAGKLPCTLHISIGISII